MKQKNVLGECIGLIGMLIGHNYVRYTKKWSFFNRVYVFKCSRCGKIDEVGNTK